jgi:Amt family ammonium transporter
MVRSTNVLSVMMQCFAITCLVTVLWVLFLYSIAFGGDGQYVGDMSKAFMNNVRNERASH